MITTYDFASKSFGHASTLVGGYGTVTADGKMVQGPVTDELREALIELGEARKCLVVEQKKEQAGKPFDLPFVSGTLFQWPLNEIGDPVPGYEHVRGRLYRKKSAPLG